MSREQVNTLFFWLTRAATGAAISMLIWIGLRMITSLDSHTQLLQQMQVDVQGVKVDVNGVRRDVERLDHKVEKIEDRLLSPTN